MNDKTLLIVSNGREIHKQHLNRDKVIQIGSSSDAAIFFPGLLDHLDVKFENETWFAGNTALAFDEKQDFQTEEKEQLSLYVTENMEARSYDVAGLFVVTFGAEDYQDVSIQGTRADFVFLRDHLEEAFSIQVSAGEVYHNLERVAGKVPLQVGDQLYVDGVTITVGQDDITILGRVDRIQTDLGMLVAADNAYSADYPDYHRSPRIIYRAPEDKFTLAKPANKPAKPTDGILKIILPPLVMIAITVLISIFQPRGIYILMTLAMTGMTVIMSSITYIKNRKEYKVGTKEREESYDLYLKRKTKELHAASEEQRHALLYHYPSIEEVRDMAVAVNSRIYEKTMLHHDFLTFRVGTGTEPISFSVDYKEEEFTQEKDELLEAATKLKAQYYEVKNIPIATDLMNGPVGYIGPRRLVLEQLQMLVMQTALFHSYFDLQFITIFPEEEKSEWDWMRWLPHANVRDVNVRGFVYHERSRDQVLNSLYQILKERKQALAERPNKNEKMYFAPHYVVLITDEKLILDHTVMEFFNEDPAELGVSLVFVQDVMQSLPEHVKTVVDIRDQHSGNIILEKGELVNRAFVPDHLPHDFDKESISRALAPLNHLQNLKNSIPESVTFLEMYGVSRVEELNIASRWEQNETYKSLAVPLGLRGKEDIVNLNLHEKAHGPHGLVAGTTGSGKSEIIQSYIISLAVNFHPYEVAFLLIDYKGGGMANLFKNMPHLLGTITNLDGAQSMRALASIKAELQKRQRLFGEHDVNHINQYQKLYKKGEASEPMPHLFLISDEFAELKSEQPEFMKELVSTARIGRSLGIHLILATQKPSGVVDDQIWSNSKFKLALKVQNASDSNEILKTPDAADITLPGRSYLQVGNNEIYELFQSAWSGADYVPDKEDEDYLDTTVYAINDLGQYEILTEDLSGLDKKEDLTKLPSELDAVIDYIHEYTEAKQIAPLPRPWLPPLEERIPLLKLEKTNYKLEWAQEKKNLNVVLGMLDQPQLQAQNTFSFDLAEEGHIAVFGSPGYGKSTFMQTILFDLVRKNSPEKLHAYLLDFGTNGLLSLKGLPHVADTLTIDDTEKILKLIRRLSQEIKERKRLLSEFGVANLKMYEEVSGAEKPIIFLIIDNYDAIKEMNDFSMQVEPFIIQIAREGASLGIHLAISAGGQNALRIQLLSNIKKQIALHLLEKNEVSNIIGRTDLIIEEVPGRAIVKLDEPTLFQTALPNEGVDAVHIIQLNQKEAEEMCEFWTGELPQPIPMVAEVLYLNDFIEYPKTIEMLKSTSWLPIGLEFEFADTIGVSLLEHNISVVTATNEQTNSLLQTIGTIVSKKAIKEAVVFDTPSLDLMELKEKSLTYISSLDRIEAKTELLHEEFKRREQAYIKEVESTGTALSRKDFFKDMEGVITIIGSVVTLFNQLSIDTQNKLLELLKSDGRVGMHFIIGNDLGSLAKEYSSIGDYIRSSKTVLLGVRFADQAIFTPAIRILQEKPLQQNEVYLFNEGASEKIKTPKS